MGSPKSEKPQQSDGEETTTTTEIPKRMKVEHFYCDYANEKEDRAGADNQASDRTFPVRVSNEGH